MMEWTIIGLFAIAILLLILSFFKTDKVTELENQIEQLSMTMIKEHYQINKKLKVFEEELIIADKPLQSNFSEKQPATYPIDRTEMTDHEQILYLYDTGLSYEEIAQEMDLPLNQVQLVIEHIEKRR